MNDATADLADRIDWMTTSLALQSARDEAEVSELLQRLAFLQHRTSRRNNTPFARLAQRLCLSESEQHVVMLLVAMRTDTTACMKARELAMAAELNLDAIRNLIYGSIPTLAAHEQLSSEGTLRRFAIIERNDEHGAHAHESKQTWSIAPRVLGFLLGNDALDPVVARLCRAGDTCSIEELAAPEDALHLAKTAVNGKAAVIAIGMDGLGRRSLLRAAATAADKRVLDVDARRTTKDAAAFRGQLRAIARECKLLECVPLIANVDAIDDAGRLELLSTDLLSLIDGPVLVTCGPQRPRIDWGRPVVMVEMSHPTSVQRAALWSSALGDISEQDVEHLATHYPLAPALIYRAAEAARARATGRALEASDVYAGIRAVLDDRLGQFAKRVSVTQSWEDLVLPQDQVDAITELIARLRERRRVYEEWGFAAKVGKGLGTSALFSGPPGTGKSMVAALIAKDLGLELYQVDLGKIVSKYIGETEKNLAALFDAAEAGHAVLLFDEADALFGKRTEVKSSNDRYANLETNYLLQRLESFTGTCILTSNHETNIDPAFLRRLSLHLRFDLPDAAEREHLWRAMLPRSAPIDDGVDVEKLAKRYALSGGYIRNAALRAAFLAANEDSAITAAHLERAARSEYEGMGKIAFSS